MKYIQYSGSFLSQKGHTWKVDILTEADEAFTQIGELTFPAADPLIFEWPETDKEEPVCSSSATVTIESPGDRTYVGLYSVAPGTVRMDVYRDGTLYWRGMLDPEFYSEPYERLDKYDVSLTFTDFGILDRLKYDLTGVQTISAVLTSALERGGLSGLEINTSMISTSIDDETSAMSLDDIAVDSANWTDEDGEQSTLREVIEELLRPLALRMIQNEGHVYIYDLNALAQLPQAEMIEWDGSSSTLSVDKAANNVKITFSPYSDSTVADCEIETDQIETDVQNQTTIRVNLERGSLNGFVIGTATDGPEAITLTDGASFFRIYPDWTKEESAGILWGFMTTNAVGAAWVQHGSAIKWIFKQPSTGDPLHLGYYVPKKADIETAAAFSFQTASILTGHITGIRPGGNTGNSLLLSLELLIDQRYNPFEDADEFNCKNDYNESKKYGGVVYIPVRVLLKDRNGNVTHYYNNSNTFYREHSKFLGVSGFWSEGAGEWGDAYLAYYTDDPENESAFGGWRKNRRMVGRELGALPEVLSWERSADGEYIPLPPESGTIEVQIGQGFYCCRGNYSRIRSARWLAYKNPSVEIVDPKGEKIETTDKEYSGYINKLAKEEIEISTMCGTADEDMLTARGVYLHAGDSSPIMKFNRQTKSGKAEVLLIGSIYSQYAQRHTMLSGETAMPSSGFGIYTEQNQGNAKFMKKGETVNAIADVSEAVFVEVSADSYESIEEVKE